MRIRQAAMGLAILWAMSFPALAGKVIIKGSNTFGEELAPRLMEAFAVLQPDIEVSVESRGSASGVAALIAGECDVASSSRVLNEDEIRMAKSRGLRLKGYTVGYYGVAVVVNESVGVKRLTDRQVGDVFAGVITNWSMLGGADRPVHVYIRDPVSGTYLGFQELAMQRRPYVADARMCRSYADIAGAVREDPDGIGYVGMMPDGLRGVRVLDINGQRPEVDAVNEGRYPYARQIRLYTDSRRETPETRKFIRFVQSRAGQKIVEQTGFVRRFEPRSTDDLTSP